MISKINFEIDELTSMKKYPEELFYIGNLELLKRKKVSIIGTRRPNLYTKEFTYKLASKFCDAGICVVSGAAMGVDAIAHQGAKANNTIAVVVIYKNKLKYTRKNLNRFCMISISK